MRINAIVFTALASLMFNNMKAQTTVFEPSLVREVPLVAEIPALGSDYKYEHKVTKLSIPGQSIKEKGGFNALLNNDSQREIGNTANKNSASTPQVLNSFKANIFNGYTPPDNTVAVSNSGYIVTSINSNVYYYDNTGQALGFSTFLKISRDYFDDLSEDLFDPRVIYDQDNDRFIMVILNGHTPEESEVLVFFSKSDNPMDGWNAYAIEGDVDNANEWFDYPNISVNKNSLFISGNMFGVNDRFTQTVVLDIDKNRGFKGETLEYSYWNNLQNSLGSAFTVVPVEKGTRGNYNESAYFVATEGSSDNLVAVYTLNNDNGNLIAREYEVNYYDIANDSEMLGTSESLDMGDNRTKTAIIIDNKIHLVHTTTTANRYAAIGYHRIDLSDHSVESLIMHKDARRRNLAYPTIASAGITNDDQSVFIAYTESGSDIYPRLCMVNVDENLEESNEVVLQEGEGIVDILEEDVERWGDYITIAKHYNSNVAWVFGCVGGANDNHDNYLIQVSLDAQASTPEIAKTPSIETYPNPVMEMVNLSFELKKRQVVNIALYNSNGQLIELLTKDAFNEGKHLLHFDMSQLSKGSYFLKIEGENGPLAQKQLVK
ncbi:MAG: T9SS type A sorting domain-containing protein [Bacteroidia bacterium]